MASAIGDERGMASVIGDEGVEITTLQLQRVGGSAEVSCVPCASYIM